MFPCLSAMCRSVVTSVIIITISCPWSGLMISRRRTEAVIIANATAYNIGKPAVFKCQLKTNDNTVYDLRFESDPTSVAERGTTSVEDNATITLSVPSLFLRDAGTLYCITNKTTLARKLIVVGAPPVAAYNISCVSYNQVSLECNAHVHETPGPLQTRWTIEYKNSGRGGVYAICSSSKECILRINNDRNTNVFFPALRHTFRVNGTNRLGRATRTFEVEPILVVKPDQAENVSALILNSTCLNVTWTDASFSSVDVQYNVTAGLQQVLVPGRIDRQTFWVVVSDVPPFSSVTVSVTSRPLLGGYTSDPTSTTVFMPEDRPSPPVIQAGSFNSVPAGARRKVGVYWQAIPRDRQHGIIRGFRVLVRQIQPRSNRTIVAEVSVPNTSVSALVDANLSMSVNYLMSVQAWTDVGLSDVVDTAQIYIPAVSKIHNTARWVESVLDSAGICDIYWDAVVDGATSTVRLHWCYGQMTSPGYVSCETSIQSRVDDDAAGDGVEVAVEKKSFTACSTCVLHFGVSMETDGINSGIVWNRCRFQKFKAPFVNDVVVSTVTRTSVLVTWGVPCVATNYGRPELINIAITSGNSEPGRCENTRHVTVTAKRYSDSVTLKVGESTMYTVCVRAVGGGVKGPWVTRNVTIPGSIALVPPEVIVGVSVSSSTVAAAILIASIYCCRRKKWFAKIQIQLPTFINNMGHPEQGRFLPPMNALPKTSTATTIKARHCDEAKTIGSNTELGTTHETVGTGLLTYVIAGDDISRDNSINICVDFSSSSSVDGMCANVRNTSLVDEKPENDSMSKKHELRASNFSLRGSDFDSEDRCANLSLSDVWFKGSCGSVEDAGVSDGEFPEYKICVGEEKAHGADGDGVSGHHSILSSWHREIW
ncbi:uncharacterized protein LOC124115152 [Haliotis rufescens]|uniref:uncharacterized protein LOC124115152 n=1 Tax=Haliotis rufescens TaxID=6454 RepID=UPI00201F7546|nr:uncharacterized protein LOC124115152 [Haliotis rufescens]